MTATAYPRRALAPLTAGLETISSSAPARALITQERKPSNLRVGLAAVAIGAVTASAAATVSLSSASEAAANAGANLASKVDVNPDTSAVRAARDGADGGAAFASRNGDRPEPDVAASVAVRNTSLAATAQQVSTVQVQAVATTRNQVLAASAKKVTQEDARRKSDGWLPGGKNPSFLRPVQGGSLTSPFGWRSNPFSGSSELHSGQDIALSCGSPIRAPQDGTVVSNGYMGSAGLAMKIQHGSYNGKQMDSGFYHAQSYIVSVGQKVSRGQVIGYVGTTGSSTGCHLHFLIWENGTNVNPMPYVNG